MMLTLGPKASAARHLLRMIVADKGAISDATGDATRRDQYGMPQLLAADNGADFRAITFTDACNNLGVTVERTIAGAPAMRGTIKRFIQT